MILTLPVANSEFADGQTAQGTEVNSQDTTIRDFINGSNFDPTDNIKVTVPYPWLARHSWTVSDSANDNLSLVVSAVMAANKYGFKVSSSAAQINSALVFFELTNSSSTVPCLEFLDAGTGSSLKITKTGNGIAFEGVQSGTAATAAPFKSSQAGTGPMYDGTLRTLAGFNAAMTKAVVTTAQTISNDATETVLTDLNITLPADFLKVGTTFKAQIWGVMSTPGAGPPDARLRVYYGGTSGTVLLDTGAFTPAVSLSNSLVKMEFLLTCISVGGAGTIEAQGDVEWNSNTIPVKRGMGTAGTGAGNSATIVINTTLSKDLTVSFKWSAAVAASSFSFRGGCLELLK